jgi:hypothetical protein
VAAAAVVVLGVAVWWAVPREDAAVTYAIDLQTTVWTAPTDFLLETPGRALLRNVPSIGIDEFITDPAVPAAGPIDTVNQPRSNS